MTKVHVDVPSMGESITEVTVSSFLVQEGSVVNEGSAIIELESDKATLEVLAPSAGKIHFLVQAGQAVAIGAKIAEIDTEAKVEAKAEVKAEVKAKEEIKAPAPSTAPSSSPPNFSSEAKPSKQEMTPAASSDPQSAPSVSKGPSLRISMDEYLTTLDAKQASHEKKTQERQVEGGVIRKPLSKLRKTIAKRLVQVKNETAMLTTFNEVDMSEVMKIRSREKEGFQKEYGAKLTFLPFFIKAAISALKAFPDVNAYIEGDEIVYNQNQHIGIAVSTPTGLVVPVMKYADQMSFLEITKEITTLAEKARDRKLTMADMSGGTFTITNGGVFGSMLSTPIINPPQSAILGMHNIVDRPVAVGGKVEIRPIMYLALSYDHRIIDGKESVSFLVHMKQLLEEPTRFILHE